MIYNIFVLFCQRQQALSRKDFIRLPRRMVRAIFHSFLLPFGKRFLFNTKEV